MRRFALLLFALTVVCAQPFPETFFAEMKWRMIGPFRGGRTPSVVGVASQPNVFYMGVNDGGVWKSTDFGQTWQPIFDDQPTGSIGVVAVAPSDPNIIYVGSGEGLQRPDLSTGDGIYKSTDAGETWRHLGLRDGQQISGIAIDPHDPNRVFAAVLGHPYGPNEERGVFRSIDGGATWSKVLFKDENTGARDVMFDPSNPRKVYVVLWAARQYPWESSANGPGSGIFVSVDGGSNWRQLILGLPTFEDGLGPMSMGISPSNPRRMYARVEARRRILQIGRRRRELAAGEQRSARDRTRRRYQLRQSGSQESGCGVCDQHVDVSIDQRGRELHGNQGCARRRRLSIHLDPSQQSGHYCFGRRSGRDHFCERRENVEFLVQPADRAVLSRDHR
jgi:hypothetical protein